MKRSVKNITLIGMVHNTKAMDHILTICDSRTLEEAQFACAESVHATYTEITNLCNLRLSSDTEKFTNKCLRFYRFVERAKISQEKVSGYLKTAQYDYLIMEKMHSIPGERSDPKKTAYLFNSKQLAAFNEKYPNYEEDISICKDYQIEKMCKIMNDFFNMYSDTIMSYLEKDYSKNVIVVMEQEHMKYLSCKDFNKRKYHCKEIVY